MDFKLLNYSLPRSRRLWSTLTLLLVVTFILASPASAWAHPLGNFTVNRYSRLELGSNQVGLYYIIDMAEIPTFQERTQIDSNGDGTINSTEQAQYLARQVAVLESKLHLEVDGLRLALEPQTQQLEFPEGQGGLPTLRLMLRFTAPLPQQQTPWQAKYSDDNYVERLGWQEIVVQAAPGITLLESTAPTQDTSQELRHYPQDLLQNPLQTNNASFGFKPQVAGEQVNNLATGLIPIPSSSQADQRGSLDRFAELINLPTPGPKALLLVLLAAFGWGAMHAFTPGHGKTVVAAYLVGSRGTARHALFLGLTTTVTHTAGVFALGVITLFISKFILPEQLYPWLGVASGLLVVVIGLSLLRERWQHRAHNHSHTSSHHHHPHGHSHEHDHSHLPPGSDGSPLTWQRLLALGVSGGLLPCPSALIVMLSAIALQRVGFGLLLIVVFSLGLAAVLTATGILFVHAGRLFNHIPARSSLLQALPIGSALFVTVIGLSITWQALVQAGVFQL